MMKFQDAIDVKRWQHIQDATAAILTISLRTIDAAGELISTPSQESELWAQILQPSPAARQAYRQWLQGRLREFQSIDPDQCYQTYCPLALSWFFLPLPAPGLDISYQWLGPVILDNTPGTGGMQRYITEFSLDADAFFRAYNKLPALDTGSMNGVLDFLSVINKFVLQIVGGTAAPLSSGHINKAEVGLLLRLLLDMAMKLCNAEFGSVMTFEQKSQLLSIQDAHGLSDDVIKQTSLKPGEGLAGLTIQQRKALFLNDQLKDRELRLRMRRPKIKSAFVIPVFYQQDVLGVISVGTAKTPNRFSDNLMDLLNELVALALDRVTFENKDL